MEIVRGATSIGIVSGYGSPDGTQQVNFLVHRFGRWDADLSLDGPSVLTDDEASATIRITGVRLSTGATSSVLGDWGSTDHSLEFNGLPIVHDVARLAAVPWSPTF